MGGPYAGDAGSARRAALDDALDAIRVASAEWGPNWEDAQSVLTDWRAELTASNVQELAESGEAPVRKRCIFCGSGPLILTWRPVPDPDLRAFSSPLDDSPWWPENWVRDARLRCLKCRNLSYGRLVGGRITEDGMVAGEFMSLVRRQEVW